MLEEQDLEQIGVLAHDHRQTILHSAKVLPQLKPIGTYLSMKLYCQLKPIGTYLSMKLSLLST